MFNAVLHCIIHTEVEVKTALNVCFDLRNICQCVCVCSMPLIRWMISKSRLPDPGCTSEIGLSNQNNNNNNNCIICTCVKELMVMYTKDKRYTYMICLVLNLLRCWHCFTPGPDLRGLRMDRVYIVGRYFSTPAIFGHRTCIYMHVEEGRSSRYCNINIIIFSLPSKLPTSEFTPHYSIHAEMWRRHDHIALITVTIQQSIQKITLWRGYCQLTATVTATTTIPYHC